MCNHLGEPQWDELFERLHYRFQNHALFIQSLTHKSYVNEHPEESARNNERMEFLGDAVLDFVITDLIMGRFEDLQEGDLSKIRARLVSEAGLAEIARSLDLGSYLRIGKGEERSGGREKPSILSDALEAVLAAIYLDSRDATGIATIFAVIGRLFATPIERVESGSAFHDYKTELQEAVQKRLKEKVVYQVMNEEGPDHDKRFEVAVNIREREYGRGRGRSKKESEQKAARSALDVLNAQEISE